MVTSRAVALVRLQLGSLQRPCELILFLLRELIEVLSPSRGLLLRKLDNLAKLVLIRGGFWGILGDWR